MVLPLDSTAVAVRRTDSPAGPPNQATGNDQRFDVAVRKAKSDRSAADRQQNAKPDETTHAVTQGETLWSIAKEFRAPFSDVVKANRQLRNPNRIGPGTVVHVPHPDPRVVNTRQAVAAAHRADDGVSALERAAGNSNAPTGERAVAQQQLPGAQAEASHQWGDIQHSVEAEIRKAGAGATFPDDASRSAVAELRGRMPKDTGYQAVVGRAVATVDGEWRNAGITRGKIDGLVRDARAADQSVASLERQQRAPRATPAQRDAATANLPGARNTADASWGKVRTEVENYLRAEGRGHPYPDELVRPHVDDIKRQYASDPKAQSAVDAARRTVTDEWRAQGWTRDTLGRIADQYGTVNKDQRAITAAQASGRGDLPTLQAQLERDRTAVRQEIERQLDDVAGKVPPDQREMAIAARAGLIQQHGPSDQAFADIVDQAAYNKVVQPGVDAVRNAFQNGGSTAAAETLRQQTENVSPETAVRIVGASLPTIGNMAADIRHLTQLGGSAYKNLVGIYSNIATATDYAARSVNGAPVTADVARVMVQEMPGPGLLPAPGRKYTSPASFPAARYQSAVERSVGSGTGATLALEMTAQLKEAGRTNEAEGLLRATHIGVASLSSNIQDGVSKFRDATADIGQSRTDWAGVMSPERLDEATLGYLAQHTDIVPNFDRAYNALDGLGYGAARTGLALHDALPRLQGLGGAGDLAKAHSDFGGANETQFALGLSQKARDEVLRVVVDLASGESGGAHGKSLVGGSRSFVKELGNAKMSSQPSSLAAVADLEANAGPAVVPQPVKDRFFTGQNVKLDPKKTSLFLGSMNGLGTVYNGYQAFQGWQNVAKDPGQLLDLTKAVYYSIGTGKEFTELLAVGAQRGWLGLDKAMPTSVSTSILAKANRKGLAGLMSEPGWPRFATFFKIGGGLIDAASGVEAFANGDPVAGTLYFASAGGGLIMGGGSVAASGTFLATWGGPLGAGIVLASAGALKWHSLDKEKAHADGVGREFLEAAGYRPEVAKALADYRWWDGRGPGPAIAATARQFGVSPGELMERLNRMDPAKVNDLVTNARTMADDDKGPFPLTAPNDRSVWAPPGRSPQSGGSYLYDPQDKAFRGEYVFVQDQMNTYEDHDVHSMTALRDYARALFGEPVLGGNR